MVDSANAGQRREISLSRGWPDHELVDRRSSFARAFFVLARGLCNAAAGFFGTPTPGVFSAVPRSEATVLFASRWASRKQAISSF